MADDSVVNKVTEKTKQILEETNKLTNREQEEAYFELVQIFSYAQATKDYAKFQADLTEWKRRYPLDYFGEAYILKIRYMLSEEFLETVLKGFRAFEELSKKDPSKGLDKMHKIFDSAKKHKNAKKLDEELENLYKEYPLSYLKEKYPHIISQLLSKTYRETIFEKFDSNSALSEYKKIAENPKNYNSADKFISALEECEKLYPPKDFNDKSRLEVEKILKESKDEKKLEELFPPSIELDLTQGEVIPIDVPNVSKVANEARNDLLKITSRNAHDIDALFDWTCKYSKYINSFDSDTKNLIVTSLMSKYSNQISTTAANYKIPSMESDPDKFLSVDEYDQIGDFKKTSVLQLLGMLYNGQELTHDDNIRLKIIDNNAKKAQTIKKAKIDKKLEVFMDVVEKHSDKLLTPSDNIYLNTSPESETEVKVEVDSKVEVHPKADEDSKVEVHPKANEDSKVEVAPKVEVVPLVDVGFTKVSTSSSSSNNSGGGGVSAGLSLPSLEDEPKNEKSEEDALDKEEDDIGTNDIPSETLPNNFFIPITAEHKIEIPEETIFTISNDENNTQNDISSQEIEPSIESDKKQNNINQPDSRENSFKNFFIPYSPKIPDSDDFER